MTTDPYYGPLLARVHHEGFGGHADVCAPGILALLRPVLATGGTILELGCGSGALTAHLVAAGHRVIATDASPAMVALASQAVSDAHEIRPLTLPDDPLPEVDAVVSVGHVINYLADRDAVEAALAACARCLRPGGVLAVDLLDLSYGEARAEDTMAARVEDDWAVFVSYDRPDSATFVREIVSFGRRDDGGWDRADETHRNVLVDTAPIPEILRAHGVDAQVGTAFGDHQLEQGMVAVTGVRR